MSPILDTNGHDLKLTESLLCSSGLAVRPHVEMSSSITVVEVKRYMRQYLAAFKVPKQVE